MSQIRGELRDARLLLTDAKLILRDFTFGDMALGPISFEVLAAVCEDPGRSSAQVADRAGITRETSLNSLRRLEQGGLIKRVLRDHLGPNNRPIYAFRPLPEGEELYGRAHAALGGPPWKKQRAA